jgi:endogenous inhibitor of DNA gyrase (YacG/DUF329 family)
MSGAAPLVNCPQCGEPTEFSVANRYRPFCSERCRLIDLGAWASDRYRVAGDPLDSDSLSGDRGGDPAGLGGDDPGAGPRARS